MNSKTSWLVEREIVLRNKSIIYSYDEEADVLEIIFQKGGGIGVDLTDHIVLRYNKESQKPLSLILTSFSQLKQPTPFGPLSFPLTPLSNLPSDMQQTIFYILSHFPVNHFLKISGLLLSPDSDPQPITHLEQALEQPFDAVLA